MNICMVSIPHTGTGLLLLILKSSGLPDWTLTETQEGIHHGHIYQAYLAKRFNCPVIAPLRHPYATEVSWLMRGKNVAEMCEGYRELVDLDPIIVPVDSPDRDTFLKDAAKRLKIRIDLKWPIVNSIGNYRLDWRTINPSEEVKELTDEIAPFLKDYY